MKKERIRLWIIYSIHNLDQIESNMNIKNEDYQIKNGWEQDNLLAVLAMITIKWKIENTGVKIIKDILKKWLRYYQRKLNWKEDIDMFL